MDLNQDEIALEGKYSTKRDPASISITKKEWMYNGIYLPSLKSEENKKLGGSNILFKMETIVDNKQYVEEVTQTT